MARPHHYFDWQKIVDEQGGALPATSSRHRLRVILALFAAAFAIVFARAVRLEIADGDEFRRLAAAPAERTVTIPARRGSILARDQSVLAADEQAKGLAIQFRYLENPPHTAWLDRLARARLSRGERRNSECMAAMRATICAELAAAHKRLAGLCGLSDDQWHARIGRIQHRVNAMADHARRRRIEQSNERRLRETEQAAEAELSLTAILGGLFAPPEPLGPREVVLAEQTAWHRVVDDLPHEAILEIEGDPKAFPGAKVVEYTRRKYPAGSLAAHLVGYVGSPSRVHYNSPHADAADNPSQGILGIELRFEPSLRGQPGEETQSIDRRGNLLATMGRRDPIAGRDLVLTIDPSLQAAAEQLLDRALRRLDQRSDQVPVVRGGAIAVMDVHNGELLAVASAPRFEPGAFVAGDARVAELLDDPRRPLFDRALKMAIPPGSVFKPLVALALLQSGVIDREQPFRCQGYWHDPDRLRCQIFRQYGVGHGDVTLADALAQSCNVYFCHHAARLGAAGLIHWATRFGFGDPAAIALPDAAAGQLPSEERLRLAGELQAFSIGQGAFTTTPLEVLRLYAAIANGGYLVAPVLTRDAPGGIASSSAKTSESQLSERTRIAELSQDALGAVRDGLRRVVDDPRGTAYATVRLPSLAIAGKTGTAQSGNNEPDHAWFAAYAPAESPGYALVVVLEHGGSGASAAGSIARNLLQRMQQLEYFGPTETARATIPHGKG